MSINNTMKKSELKKLVREAIKTVLSEDAQADKAAQDAKKVAIDKEIAALNKKKQELAKGPQSTLAEEEIEEMANVAVTYQLADDADVSTFTGKKQRILNTMQASGEPMSKMAVASEMGYDKQNPINADFMSLVAAGVIVPTGEQAAPRLNRPEPTVNADGTEEPQGEEGFVDRDLSDEEVDAMFAAAKASGEDTPEIGDVETSDVSGSMSDEDYEAFMKYTDLEARLGRVKSDILKAKKQRPGGEFNDKPSTELQRLQDLKASLEKRTQDLLASNEYLQKRYTKMTGKDYVKPEPLELDDEEDTLDEWVVGQLQYRAGIKR